MTSDAPTPGSPRTAARLAPDHARADGIVGAVLAAGAGRRFGGPKALARDGDGVPWLQLATSAQLTAGIPQVFVVLGAAAEEALELVPDDARVRALVAPDWSRGQSASLATALAAADATDASALLVTLVDLPGLPASSVARLVEAAVTTGLRRALAQATFDSRPGHPVVVGRDHWPALVASLDGDTGARDYVRSHGAEFVECGDLGDGEDVDVSAGAGTHVSAEPH